MVSNSGQGMHMPCFLSHIQYAPTRSDFELLPFCLKKKKSRFLSSWAMTDQLRSYTCTSEFENTLYIYLLVKMNQQLRPNIVGESNVEGG